MTPLKITLIWDKQNGVTAMERSTRKSLHVGDEIKFVARPAGTPLVVFLQGSPFSKKRPHWIRGSGVQATGRVTRRGSPRLKFLCAMIAKGKVLGGKGGKLPPIKP